MKIIQVVRNFSNGDTGRFVIDLSNQLYKNGHEVTIIRYQDEQELNSFEPEVNPGIRVLTINRRKRIDLNLMIKLRKFLADEQPDIVHTHMNDAFLLLLISFLALPAIAFFHTLHHLPVEEAGSKAGLSVRKNLFKRNRVVPVAIANDAIDLTKKIYGIGSLPLIYNGIECLPKTPKYREVYHYVNSLRENPGTKIILTKGGLTEQKNLMLLVKTVRQLNNEGYKVKLLILGGDQSAQALKQMRTIADDHIILLGNKNNIQDYLYASDIFCLPSLKEGMPISLMEAFCAGCIPVCTPAGGVASMVQNDINGFLAAGFRQEDLFNAFKRYFKSKPDKIATIAQNGFSAFKRLYNIEVCTNKYVQLYYAESMKKPVVYRKDQAYSVLFI